MYDLKNKKSLARTPMKAANLDDIRKNARITKPKGLINVDKLIDTGKDLVNKYTPSDLDLGAALDAASNANNALNKLTNKDGLGVNISSASFGGTTSDSLGYLDSTSGSRVLADNLRYLASLDSLSYINGLPPIPDNVVDPPLEIKVDDFQNPIESWKSNMVGRDYVKRVLSNGQYLVLVPIELEPRNFGALMDKSRWSTKAQMILSKVEDRLDVTSYGFHSKVNSLRYWKTVQAHFKTALIALGIQNIAGENKLLASKMELYMPQEIVEKILYNNNGKTLFSEMLNGSGSGELAATTSNDENGVTNLIESFKNGSTDALAKVVDNPILSDQALEIVARYKNIENIIRWVTNIDVNDEVNKSLPFTIYYCNGPVERSMASSTELGESAIARMTTDIKGKIGTQVMDSVISQINSKNKSGIFQLDASNAEEYLTELSYHNGLGTMVVSNTWIPKVIKNALLNQTYTVNIKEMVVSSDRFSKARVQWTLCQLIPFVIPTNEPNQPLLMPRTTMYCSAFVKGVMNLPRAAITSMSVRTSPEFQTSEGIPTELDISLTIQPLYDLSAMPDFDKWYSGASEPIHLVASMYNPQSSFNIIATMCGQNTVLTKFNQGMLSFFVGGTVTSVFSSVKGTGNVVSSLWRDFKSSGTGTRNSIMSTLRVF